MKRLGLFAAAVLAAALFLTGTVFAAEIDPVERSLYPDTGFKVTYKGIKYVKPNGEFLKDSWLFIGQQAWCFDGDGLMATGVRVVNGKEWNLSYEGKAAPMDAIKAASQLQNASPAAGAAKAPEAAKAPASNSLRAPASSDSAKAPASSDSAKAPASPDPANAPASSPSAKTPAAAAPKAEVSSNTAALTPEAPTASNGAAAAPVN